MSEWKGKVSKINSRNWGTKTLYSWQLDGANLWFRCDSDPTGVIAEGAWVTFEGPSPNKIDFDSIEIVKEEEVKQAASTTTSTKLASNEAPPTNSPDYWRWKQMHDLIREDAFMWRDARADAVRVITACLDHDKETGTAKDSILALGTKKSGRLDVLRGMINELSDQFVTEMKERLSE